MWPQRLERALNHLMKRKDVACCEGLISRNSIIRSQSFLQLLQRAYIAKLAPKRHSIVLIHAAKSGDGQSLE